MKLGRKKTGGRLKQHHKTKLHERMGQKKTVKLGEDKLRSKRTRGGNSKTFLLKAQIVNISEKGKSKKATIKNVTETPSNRFLARQNILTKGTIVETDFGKVKITSRPTQEGTLNGILVK